MAQTKRRVEKILYTFQMTKILGGEWVGKLQNGEDVYIHDGFEDFVVKLTPEKDGTRAFIRRRGQGEYELSQSAKIVYEATVGGKLVDERFYKNF